MVAVSAVDDSAPRSPAHGTPSSPRQEVPRNRNSPLAGALAKQDAGREAGDRNLSHNRPQEADILKHVMAVTVVSAFALTSALAQTSSPPASSDSKSSPPAASSTP